MISDAEFSPCGRYRYTLTRIWDESKPLANWCAMNPSTADQHKNDPTITREINFSKAWGFGGMIKTNIMAFRSPKPEILRVQRDPCGPENLAYIESVAMKADKVIVAWGSHPMNAIWAPWVYAKALKRFSLFCLGQTKDGSPRHPLYVKGTVTLQPFQWRKV